MQRHAMATKLKAKQQRASQEPKSLGINTQKPKYPQYAVVSKRLESFKEWPEYLPLDPIKLVEAGLVYTGVGDSVRCYHCGGGLKNWEEGDDPWVEHARWHPDCGHILLVKGQKYVEQVIQGNVPEENNTISGQNEKSQEKDQTSTDPMSSVAVQSCLEMGFDPKLVQMAVKMFISSYHHSNFEGSDIATIALEIEDGKRTPPSGNVFDCSQPKTGGIQSEEEEREEQEEQEDPELLQKLAEENARLKENKMCKICLDDLANIIFLPCGHMVSCPMCAPALLKCPICRKGVKGYVKAFCE